MAISFRGKATAANGAAPTSLTVPAPLGLVNGDVMIAFIVMGAEASINVVPSGWTQVDMNLTQVSGTSAANNCRHYLFSKAAANEGTAFTWGFNGGTDCAGAVLAYSGVDNTSPISIENSVLNNPWSKSQNCPASTAALANSVVLYAFGINPGATAAMTFTTPSSTVFRAEADPGAGTTNRAVLAVFEQGLSAAGTVSAQATTLNTGARGVGYTVVLAPYSVTAPPITVTIGPTRTNPTTAGCMVGWGGQGLSATQAIETNELGQKFACYRSYNNWNVVKSEVTSAVNAGKLVLSSNKPPTGGNGWVQIAGSTAHDSEIQNMVNLYKAYNREIVFIFHHEPHDQAKDLNPKGTEGNAADYVAAFRKIAGFFNDPTNGAPKVKIGYCAVAFQNAAGAGALHVPDYCWPGEDVVDVICHDQYNWWTYNGSPPWKSFETIWAPVVALGVKYSKPIIIGEYGSHPSVSGVGDRSQWFRDAAAYIKDPNKNASKYLIGLCYFHHQPYKNDWAFLDKTLQPNIGPSGGTQQSYLPGGSNYNSNNNYPAGAKVGDPEPYYGDGKQGFIDAFVNDSYFKDVPFPVALNSIVGGGTTPPPSPPGSPPPPPPPPPPTTPTPVVAREAGIASVLKFGTPTVTQGGAQTIYVGTITDGWERTLNPNDGTGTTTDASDSGVDVDYAAPVGVPQVSQGAPPPPLAVAPGMLSGGQRLAPRPFIPGNTLYGTTDDLATSGAKNPVYTNVGVTRVSGGVRLSAAANGVASITLGKAVQPFTNFEATMVMRITPGASSTTAAYFNFRYIDANNRYQFVLTTIQVLLQRQLANVYTNIGTWTYSTSSATNYCNPYAWNTMQVTVVSQTIDVRVNGIRRLTYAIPAGEMAPPYDPVNMYQLSAFNGSGISQVDFQTIRIRPL